MSKQQSLTVEDVEKLRERLGDRHLVNELCDLARRWLEHTGGPGMEWSVEEQQYVPQASSDEYADTGFDAGVKCLECGAHPPEPHDWTCQRSIFNKRKRSTSDDVLTQLESLAPGWDGPFNGLFSRAAAHIRGLSQVLSQSRDSIELAEAEQRGYDRAARAMLEEMRERVPHLPPGNSDWAVKTFLAAFAKEKGLE